MNKINKQLKDSAIKAGLCEEWQEDWGKNKSDQELVDMYKRGINFCFKKSYPDNGFIKDNFGQKLLHDNNIYIDEEFNVSNPENSIVSLGESKGSVMVKGFSVCEIYTNGDSELEVTVEGFSKAFITVYGRSNIKVSQIGNSRVFVYKRSNECKLSTSGDVRIREIAD